MYPPPPIPGQVPGQDGGVPPHPVLDGVPPPSGLDRVPPPSGLDMAPPGQDWMGYPLSRTGWGTPHNPGLVGVTPPPFRTGWGTPCPGLDGVPPPASRTGCGTPCPRLDGVTPLPTPPRRRQSSIESTCYTAGGMPLAFTQEECLVNFTLKTKKEISITDACESKNTFFYLVKTEINCAMIPRSTSLHVSQL